MEQITEFERKKIFLQQYQESQKRISALAEEMEKWGYYHYSLLRRRGNGRKRM